MFGGQGKRREKEIFIFHSPPRCIPCTRQVTKQDTAVLAAMSLPVVPQQPTVTGFFAPVN